MSDVRHGLESFRARVDRRAALGAHEAIRQAQPFIDTGIPDNRYLPSELLLMGWSMIAIGIGGVDAADRFVFKMLDEASKRWAKGYYPMPFGDPVRVDPSQFHAQRRERD